ncbi:MAG: hypothetical protein LBC97_02850 [Bifidobacteriaceae bacterium]|jgi:hypothetical protein|nr:hypothetical protein [Bifidobacteriaceae bacterium]
MDWTGSTLVTLAAAALVVGAVWYAASRVDRMHRRVENAWGSLQLQLTRRASVALDLAHEDLWDPVASMVVAEAARGALEAPPWGAEHSELSAVLRAAAGDRAQVEADFGRPDREPLLRELSAAWYRAILARRFLNEAVSMTARLRSRRLVRWLHLAGRTPMPQSCDIDDAPPDGLISQ